MVFIFLKRESAILGSFVFKELIFYSISVLGVIQIIRNTQGAGGVVFDKVSESVFLLFLKCCFFNACARKSFARQQD
jgi:hypothetical protein